MQLPSKVALVTGGAKRVGRAIVRELAAGGCDLAVHYRKSKKEAADLARELTAQGRRVAMVEGELADPAVWPRVVQETVDQLGRLDILVNNASMFDPSGRDRIDAATFDPDNWHRMLQVNLVAPVALCHSARKHLAAHGQGKIVNLVDIAAERPWANQLAYCSSKAALVAATKALAKALAPQIQVNAVAPGIAVFPVEYSPQLREKLVAQVPLQREGTPEEIAKAVRFLVEHGDYITGEVINVDGGRSMA
jgi:pteridine reductase